MPEQERRGRAPIGEPSDQWREYRGAPTGTDIECEGWRQEAALRMLNNNLDPEVAEDPENLVVYGGTGRAARSWDAYDAILDELRDLGDEETLLVQSGKPVGRFETHERAPRVLIANSNLVGAWDDWDHFHELEAEGKIVYGQMTAGSWAYIGTQGIIQGTYETLAELGRREFDGGAAPLRGRVVVTGGLGGMSGAQPLAVELAGGACIAVEVDEDHIDRRIETDYCREKTDDLDEAIERAREAAAAGEPYSVGVHGNAADALEEMLDRGFVPDVITDQTSAHDPLEGYYPSGHTVEEADRLRERDPDRYRELALDTMERHVDAILELQERGAVAVEYGNNIRGQVREHRGREDAFDFPGFVPAYIRPMFCRGKGPFRWAALSGDPEDIHRTDRAIKELFPEKEHLHRWIDMAQERIAFQGLPSRVCWLGYRAEDGLTERARFAVRINDLVADGGISAPVVVTRDHLDAGSVASPNRETEGMRDGTDAVADWPILNALLNTAAGADIVSVHDGGGVGIGNSLHTNNHVVLDGTERAAETARRVFTTDPGMGVVRHADAGYEDAREEARESGVHVPMDDG
jgi:urocanate hydratase